MSSAALLVAALPESTNIHIMCQYEIHTEKGWNDTLHSSVLFLRLHSSNFLHVHYLICQNDNITWPLFYPPLTLYNTVHSYKVFFLWKLKFSQPKSSDIPILLVPTRLYSFTRAIWHLRIEQHLHPVSRNLESSTALGRSQL